jgi:hypothetical protein
MQALLGKITAVKPSEGQQKGHPENGRSAHHLEIGFKAACVLPARARVPEWLKDQTLTLDREVIDPREIGHAGDSLVLTPAESERWLFPLTVEPAVAYGEVPPFLTLRLKWWKDDKPPDYMVRINGQCRSGPFTRDGLGWTARVETESCFPAKPKLPVSLEVTCDKMKVACAVLPEREAVAARLLSPEGERYRLDSGWYSVEVNPRTHAAGIVSLREKGRDADLFLSSGQLIEHDFESGGHQDRFKIGWEWSEKVKEAALTCAGLGHEGGVSRLRLEGVVDEGQGLRTSVVYSLYDELPLLLVQRDFQFLRAKKEGEGKEKEEKPKEPIDDVQPVRLGFRAATAAERNGRTGSRILCADRTGVVSVRPAEIGEEVDYWNWQMVDGWAIVEHPHRREHLLYLFDPQAAPRLATWLGPGVITLEPYWPVVPVRPDESIGYSLALTAGELCGADSAGAWVACRGIAGDVTVCAVVGRIARPLDGSGALFRLGGRTVEAPLYRMPVPGVGDIVFATAEFPEGRRDDAFDAVIGGIRSRSSL